MSVRRHIERAARRLIPRFSSEGIQVSHLTGEKPTVTLEPPPETEIPCYLRDPDGHLIEAGLTTRRPG
jgi:hypothetical protein